MMMCVSTYATLVNAQSGFVIKPTRGICQKDQISSYLYLICVECLSQLLNEVKRSKQIRGVKVAHGSPSINHLFFTDNNLIFCIANNVKWQSIQSLLDLYEEATSQGINKFKISVFFSFSTNRTIRDHILELAGISLYSNQE